MPTLILIAGPNGAGKTTFAKEFLPHEAACMKFLNADEIARGLSPLDPTASAVHAGRLLLGEFKKLVSRGQSFALESTISGHTYIRQFREAKEQGYTIELHYLWISSPLESIARVKQRVSKGGHHVPAADIRRRFARSLVNLADHYLPLADRWVIWDNQISPPRPLANHVSHTILQAIQALK
jgi:predicted ABC-type ATPase